MGATLTKPVMSTIIERKSFANGFRVGLAEMNGWRNKMEDAHVIKTWDDRAFFGVFDGHGGDQCSAYVAKEFYARLEAQGLPEDDETLKNMILSIDADFLATGTSSGTTGAMCIVHRPTEPGGKFRLRVANVGDSRVLLGKRDGTIVDGGEECTDQGLTTDHKPNHPSERERIYRCGGTVEEAEGGVARVNGDLAVSRCFGDAEYKKTGGPAPEDRPVTAYPELGEFTCDEDDILIIVCDGVSEGDFPNPEVVKLISQRLKETNDDLGITSRDVIFKAEEKNSRDNITCMIITFNSKDGDTDATLFTPGPLACPSEDKFMNAYEAMAKRADQTLAQAAELRFDNITAELAEEGLAEDKREALKKEVDSIGEPEGEKGNDVRREWFETWLATNRAKGGGGAPGGIDPSLSDMVRQMALSRMGLGPGMNAQQKEPDGRRVRAPNTETLKASVEGHPELSWDDRMQDLADAEGIVQQEDTSDGTMQVKFPPPLSVVAWLPTAVLDVVEGSGGGAAPRCVEVGGYEGGAAPAAP